MNHDKAKVKAQEVPYGVDKSADALSDYGGIPALKASWQQLGVETVLAEANIHYGQGTDKVGDMSLLLLSAPFVRANSHRKVTQRFGGEAACPGEADPLLVQQTQQAISQRTLNRFVTNERYEWLRVQVGRVQQWQQQAGYKTNRKGVVVVDDWPLVKPYARAMPYLSSIWDNNRKQTSPGYAIVHLYYYHPHLPSYSLGMYPWLKTSLTGEKKAKGQVRRPARADEERSKLDVALLLIDELVGNDHLATVIFDSWYMARWFGYQLSQRGHSWIGEASGKQKFEVNGQYLTVAQIYAHYRHHLQRVPGQKRSVKAVSLLARIRPDRYTKVTQPVKLVLVTGLHQPRDNDKGYQLLVCNRRHYRRRRIVRLFAYRPRVEPVHRQGKQHAGWLDFHNRSLQALLCHLTFCLFRADCLAYLHQQTPAARSFSVIQFIDHCLQVTVRLVWQLPYGWRPLLQPEHPLWSFYRQPALVHR